MYLKRNFFMNNLESSSLPENFFSCSQWKSTLSFLQTLIHTLKDFQVKNIEEMTCSLQHSLKITKKGFNSFNIPDVGQFSINLEEKTIYFYNTNEEPLFKTSFVNIELSKLFKTLEGWFSSIDQKFDYPTENIASDRISDSSQALDIYSKMIWDTFTTLARVKAILPLNPTTPIAYWTHHFDMGFLYFYTGKSDSERDPHINIGFSPIGEENDEYNYPYYYIYCWNGSEYIKNFTIPEGIIWQNYFCKLSINKGSFDHQGTEKLLSKTINVFLRIGKCHRDLM